MSTPILVVGATGVIGREVVAALATNSKARVVVGARDSHRLAKMFQSFPTVRCVALDLDTPQSISQALAEVEKIVVINPLAPTMAKQIKNLVEVAKPMGIRQLVRFGLMGAGEPSPILEARWHNEADQAVETSGIPFTLLRPTQYFQNFLSPGNAEGVRLRGTLVLPVGRSKVSYVDTRDLGAAAAQVLLAADGAHDGKSYVLTGGEAYSMDDVAQTLGQALNKPVNYLAVEPAAYREGMLAAGIPELITDAVLGWFAYCREGRAERVVPDTERLLGRKPLTLGAFVRDHLKSFQDPT